MKLTDLEDRWLDLHSEKRENWIQTWGCLLVLGLFVAVLVFLA